MNKPVKSTDPRKPVIMRELKRISGANKVTLVTEKDVGVFEGHCQKGNRSGYTSLGFFTTKIVFGVDSETGDLLYNVLESDTMPRLEVSDAN